MKYLSCGEVEERYRVSRSTVLRWQTDPRVGFPKPRKIGHRILWSEADLDAFDQKIADQN